MKHERSEVGDRRPTIRTEVVLRDKPFTAYFPSLDGLPVNAMFSWGKGLPNLSQKFGDASAATESTWNLLTDNGFARPPMMVRINPGEKQKEDIYVGDEYDSFEVTRGMIEQHIHPANVSARRLEKGAEALRVRANFIFTRDPFITLSVFPADCPSAVIYAVGTDGRPLVGIAHWGRKELVKMDPYFAIKRLVEKENIDTSSIRVAIMPGIAKENYYVQQKDLEKDVSDFYRWGSRLINQTVDGEHRSYLDLLGRTMDLLEIAGVQPEQIEAYDVDTYAAADREEAYSHRYATHTNQPGRNGRMMLAAELLQHSA